MSKGLWSESDLNACLFFIIRKLRSVCKCVSNYVTFGACLVCKLGEDIVLACTVLGEDNDVFVKAYHANSALQV